MRGQTVVLVVVVTFLAIAGGSVQASTGPVDGAGITADTTGELAQSGGVPASAVDHEDEHEQEHEQEHEEEAAFNPLGDWWGLGSEAEEAPFVGVVEIGVVLLAVGVLGYRLVKRRSILPVQYRRYQLQTHQWVVLVGTGLTLPHFVAVGEWEGLGLAVGVLLGVEVASGLYGRYLHRHVIRLGRGEEIPSVVGRTLDVTKQTLFARWRRIHILLTIGTGLVLVLHIVTAVE